MILLVFLIATLLGYYFWRRRRLYYLASKIKGPSGYPVIGTAYKFLNANKIFEYIQEYDQKWGTPGKFWLCHRLFVYVNSAKQFEIILNSPECLDKGDSYDFIAESVGYGLITLQSDSWRFHRKNLNASFGHNIITSFCPIFNKHIQILMKRFEPYANGVGTDIQYLIKACALDMVSDTTLGLNLNFQSGENDDFFHKIDTVMLITGRRFFRPWIQPKLLFRLSPYYHQFTIGVAKLKQVIEELLATKKDEYRKFKEELANNNKMEIEEKNIFIDRILRLLMDDHIFTDEDVISELRTILLAGYETTATAATSVLTLLAIHPKYQERMFEEIRTVLPNQESDVTLDDLKNMPYVDALIKESLRFLPVAPLLTRVVREEMQLEDLTIPKGTEYLMDIMNLHRKQENWKFDATQFNPANFFPENALPRSQYSYIPFGAGPRQCIGMRYGNIVLKLFVVYLVRKYRFTTTLKLEDLQFEMNITLHMMNKNVFQIHKRSAY